MEDRKDSVIHLCEFQLVWPLGSRVESVSKGAEGKKMGRGGWGLRQSPGRKKAGPLQGLLEPPGLEVGWKDGSLQGVY